MTPLLGVALLSIGLDYRLFAGEAGLLSVSIAEILSYILGFFLLLEAAIHVRSRTFRVYLSRLPDSFLFRLYVVWIVLAAGSLFLLRGSADGLHSLKDIVPALLLYAGILYWARSCESVTRCVQYVRVMLIALAAIAIAQFIAGWPYVNRIDANAYTKVRFLGDAYVGNPVIGTFGSPNAYAAFAGPLTLVTLFHRNHMARLARDPSILGPLLVSGVLLCGLVLSQAKMALGLVLLALLGWIVVRKARIPISGRAVAWTVLTGVLFTVLVLVGIGFAEPHLPPALGLGSLRGRVGLAIEALVFLSQDPVMFFLGGGVQLFEETVPVFYNVHSEYLHQWLMWGVVGMVLYVGLLMRAIRQATRVGWAFLFPMVVLTLIFFVETASGNQLQAMTFGLIALVDATWRRNGQTLVATSPGD